jgi:hypothetical protein
MVVTTPVVGSLPRVVASGHTWSLVVSLGRPWAHVVVSGVLDRLVPEGVAVGEPVPWKTQAEASGKRSLFRLG